MFLEGLGEGGEGGRVRLDGGEDDSTKILVFLGGEGEVLGDATGVARVFGELEGEGE